MAFDLNWLRAVVTLLSFAGFVAIAVWAWSRRNRDRFDEAAALPFLDDRAPSPLRPQSGARHE